MSHYRFYLFGSDYNAIDAVAARVDNAKLAAPSEHGENSPDELRARIDELTDIVGRLVSAISRNQPGPTVAAMTIRPEGWGLGFGEIDHLPRFPYEEKPND